MSQNISETKRLSQHEGRQALQSLNEKREQITQPAAPRPAAKHYGKIWTKMT
jgi:hypothetical protein